MGSKIYTRRPCAPRRPPSRKMLTHAQVLAYVYIIVNLQLRSSINARLTERSLYNQFCIERSPKIVFFSGILGVGAKIFCGNSPRNAMTADLRRLVKKCGDALNTLVCTSGKVITKKTTTTKRNIYAVRVTFHPFAVLTPLNP